MQEFYVPQSVSTFYKLKSTALLSTWGKFRIGISKREFLLINKLFDNKKVVYSSKYYTNLALSTELYNDNVKQIILKIAKNISANSIIEIGCGQGNLVKFLHKKKFHVLGYDPIISKNSRNLKKGYYPTVKNKQPADLYILQCVLPHINHPKTYLESIFAINEGAHIYIEFPNLNFILKNRLWYQFSYEHINYFTFNYFQKYFSVVKQGSYLGGEWSYVLIKNKKYPTKSTCIVLCYYVIWCELVLRKRKSDLKKITEKINDKTLFIFGAGGKGAMLAAHIHTQSKDIDMYMIDNDTNKHNLFLGSSGIKVISVKKALSLVKKDSFVIAANPNHKSYVLNIFSSHCTVLDLKTI